MISSQRTALIAMAAIGSFTVGHVALAQSPQEPGIGSRWSGWSAGIDLGVRLSATSQSLQVNDPMQSLSAQGASADQGALFPRSLKSPDPAIIGGVHLAYQIATGHLVYGIVADVRAGGKSSASQPSLKLNDPTKAPFPDYFSTTHASQTTQWLSTARARLGYGGKQVLVYADAGVAVGRVKSVVDTSITNVNNPPSDVWTGYSARTKAGFAAGAGAQFALTRQVSVGLDYLYYDLGRANYATTPDTFTTTDQPGVSQTIVNRANGHLISATIDYRF